MDIKGIAFDVNGTLVEILTDDGMEHVFRAAGHYLSYQGIDVRRHHLRDLYFELMKEQISASPEEHPEYDAVGIWRSIVEGNASDYTRALPAAKLAQLPLALAELSRGVSRRRLKAAPHAVEMIEALRGRFRLAIITDAQSAWARAELHKVGLLDYFDIIIVSGDYGYRKPDGRLFQLALHQMGVRADQAMYVGNDMHRDIFGAREAGMTTVMYESDQGAKEHLGCVPDYTIADFRDLVRIVG